MISTEEDRNLKFSSEQHFEVARGEVRVFAKQVIPREGVDAGCEVAML
jgi:hypothetical protein